MPTKITTDFASFIYDVLYHYPEKSKKLIKQAAFTARTEHQPLRYTDFFYANTIEQLKAVDKLIDNLNDKPNMRENFTSFCVSGNWQSSSFNSKFIFHFCNDLLEDIECDFQECRNPKTFQKTLIAIKNSKLRLKKDGKNIYDAFCIQGARRSSDLEKNNIAEAKNLNKKRKSKRNQNHEIQNKKLFEPNSNLSSIREEKNQTEIKEFAKFMYEILEQYPEKSREFIKNASHKALTELKKRPYKSEDTYKQITKIENFRKNLANSKNMRESLTNFCSIGSWNIKTIYSYRSFNTGFLFYFCNELLGDLECTFEKCEDPKIFLKTLVAIKNKKINLKTDVHKIHDYYQKLISQAPNNKNKQKTDGAKIKILTI